ncbi:hypothetical protein QO001_006210 [Methylobacterium brachiatum]|uniref:Uncharacterized protein n=1 Tax=Methylobacterium brachiatum TaxID=269660 RepID=A0AAJ1TYG5_9HYPH|nr:hypothetical protein [Methylobacterium brachiatum]
MPDRGHPYTPLAAMFFAGFLLLLLLEGMIG